MSSERLWPLAPLGVGAVSFLLGLVHLTKYPWWHDEKITARVATQSLAGIWRAARGTEQAHFLYYLGMKAWFRVIDGPGNHWLARFPSVIWLALAAATLTALGTRLFGRTVGVLAGLILATNFLFLHWEQFARDLTISLFTATFATYAFVRMVQAPTLARWAWVWAASVVVASWVELFGVCILAGHAAGYVVRTRIEGEVRPGRRREVLLGAAAFALVIPNMVLIATAINGQFVVPQVSLRRLVSQPWVWAGRNPVALIGCAVGLAVLAAALRPASRLADGHRVEPWKVALTAGLFVSPFLVTLLLSPIKPAWESHYFFSATPALALLVGVAIVWLPGRLGVALLACMCVGAGLLMADFYALRPYGNFWSLF